MPWTPSTLGGSQTPALTMGFPAGLSIYSLVVCKACVDSQLTILRPLPNTWNDLWAQGCCRVWDEKELRYGQGLSSAGVHLVLVAEQPPA